MAKSAAERMANLRARQRRAGLTSVTVVVPQADAKSFAALAMQRRQRLLQGRRGRSMVVPNSLARPEHHSAISAADVMQLRELLEVTAVGLVVSRMSLAVERRLRGLLEWEAHLDADAADEELQRFHATLGELSADPALRFLLRVALRLTEEHSSFAARPRRERAAVVGRIKRGHRGIAEAILARNLPRAEQRMRRYLSGLKDWIE